MTEQTGEQRDPQLRVEVSAFSLMVHSACLELTFLRAHPTPPTPEKLRVTAIEAPDLLAEDPDFRIVLVPDTLDGTLTIATTASAWTATLVRQPGTIARPGTAPSSTAFLAAPRARP
jgi:hypothetical protein